jgi:hypothetical protein
MNHTNIFIALIIYFLFISCKKEKEEINRSSIQFSIEGIVDNQEVNYNSIFSTVRDSYYSNSYNLSDSITIFEFIRYSEDMKSYIEIILQYDTISNTFKKNSIFNALNYSINFDNGSQGLKIEHETVIIVGTYANPNNFFDNVSYNQENETISGTFNYEKDFNDQYNIFGEFSLLLKN